MKLEEYRDEIDHIDKRIVGLLNRRAALVREIGAIKTAAGLPVIDWHRESKVLEGLMEANEGMIDDKALARIYRAVLLECRQIQVQMNEEAVEEGVPMR
jgi:chorismate mutase